MDNESSENIDRGELTPSQNDIDLNNFEESILPSINTVIKNAEDGKDTPSFIVAKRTEDSSSQQEPFSEFKRTEDSLETEQSQKTGIEQQNNSLIKEIGISSEQDKEVGGNVSVNTNPKEKKPYSKKYDGTLLGSKVKIVEVVPDKSRMVPLRTALEIAQEKLEQQNNRIIIDNASTNEAPNLHQEVINNENSISQQAKLDANHLEALNSNNNMNQGFKPLVETSGKDFFNKIDNVAQQAKLDANHQEALDTNKNMNQNIYGRLSDTGRQFFNDENSISQQAKLNSNHMQEATNGVNNQVVESLPTPPVIEGVSRPVADNLPPVSIIEGVSRPVADNLPPVSVIEGVSRPVADNLPPVSIIEGVSGPVVDLHTPSVIEGVSRPITDNLPPVIEGGNNHALAARIAELENQIRQLRGENTLEQQSAAIGNELERLISIQAIRELTDVEKIRYFDITQEKSRIDAQINRVETAEKGKRERKEKWIKIASMVVGAGVAFATPAIGVAGIVAVTLGGGLIGKGMKKWGESLRSKSTALKYESRAGKTIEELSAMDRKRKRLAFWANRLGEASSIIAGGVTGYAVGSAIENVFGMNSVVHQSTQPVSSSNTVANTNGTIHTGEIVKPITGSESIPSSIGGGSEQWLNGDVFKASDFGWNSKELGWLGNEVHIGPLGGADGEMQGVFFRTLQDLVPKNEILGQANAEIINPFFRQIYQGIDPVKAAQAAAKALLA